MNGKDFISVLEYMKAFNKPPKALRTKKPKNEFDEFNLTLLLHKKLEEADALKKLLDDREKANKKEEKKEEKKGMDAPTIAMWLVLSFPITGPLYLKFLSTMVPNILH